MKPIDFMFVGTPKQDGFKTLEAAYRDKIKRYTDSTVLYLKDSVEKNSALKCEKESRAILEHLKASDAVILCDERGQSFSSLDFSTRLATWQETSKRVVFIVGGAYGVSDACRSGARALLTLSPFTLPHELARVVLLEQVYRALTIQNGEKYHHG